jgi:hypothetical protein
MNTGDPQRAPSLWERVAHNLQEMYTEAMGWTGEKARIGVKRMDILTTQRQIRRHMAELGGRVYDRVQHGESVESDASVQSLIGTIRRLEEELEALEREIEDLRGRRSTPHPEEGEADPPRHEPG